MFVSNAFSPDRVAKFLWRNEVHLEPYQTSQMEPFVKITAKWHQLF